MIRKYISTNFKCLEAKCRENPGNVRAQTYDTKSPSQLLKVLRHSILRNCHRVAGHLTQSILLLFYQKGGHWCSHTIDGKVQLFMSFFFFLIKRAFSFSRFRFIIDSLLKGLQKFDADAHSDYLWCVQGYHENCWFDIIVVHNSLFENVVFNLKIEYNSFSLFFYIFFTAETFMAVPDFHRDLIDCAYFLQSIHSPRLHAQISLVSTMQSLET